MDHWLDPAVRMLDELKPMLQQFPGDEMQSWAVGKEVGNVKNQGPSRMEPIDVPHDLKSASAAEGQTSGRGWRRGLHGG